MIFKPKKKEEIDSLPNEDLEFRVDAELEDELRELDKTLDDELAREIITLEEEARRELMTYESLEPADVLKAYIFHHIPDGKEIMLLLIHGSQMNPEQLRKFGEILRRFIKRFHLSLTPGELETILRGGSVQKGGATITADDIKKAILHLGRDKRQFHAMNGAKLAKVYGKVGLFNVGGGSCAFNAALQLLIGDRALERLVTQSDYDPRVFKLASELKKIFELAKAGTRISKPEMLAVARLILIDILGYKQVRSLSSIDIIEKITRILARDFGRPDLIPIQADLTRKTGIFGALKQARRSIEEPAAGNSDIVISIARPQEDLTATNQLNHINGRPLTIKPQPRIIPRTINGKGIGSQQNYMLSGVVVRTSFVIDAIYLGGDIWLEKNRDGDWYEVSLHSDQMNNGEYKRSNNGRFFRGDQIQKMRAAYPRINFDAHLKASYKKRVVTKNVRDRDGIMRRRALVVWDKVAENGDVLQSYTEGEASSVFVSSHVVTYRCDDNSRWFEFDDTYVAQVPYKTVAQAARDHAVAVTYSPESRFNLKITTKREKAPRQEAPTGRAREATRRTRETSESVRVRRDSMA
jgi:hypothetical protein